MQQFQVPQFITVEDRVIGPLTIKQFLYLLGALGVGFLGWFFFPLVLFIVIPVPIAVAFVGMAFGKIQNRPLPEVVFSAITYYLKPRLYLWKHIEEKPKAAETMLPTPPTSPLLAPHTTESRLKDLAWSLDVQERLERTSDDLADTKGPDKRPLVAAPPHR